MVRQESIDELKEILNRKYTSTTTVGNIEIQNLKRSIYSIVPHVDQEFQSYILCDNTRYAAELVCEFDESDSIDYWVKRFTDMAVEMGLDHNKPVGLNVILF